VSDELNEDGVDVETMEIDTSDDGEEEEDEPDLDEVNKRDTGTLSQKSIFNWLYKVESRFEHDAVTYEKAINT
jgi:hypothetical protein